MNDGEDVHSVGLDVPQIWTIRLILGGHEENEDPLDELQVIAWEKEVSVGLGSWKEICNPWQRYLYSVQG